MFNNFEKIKPYKNLLKNFTSLSILQISNYLFPLITLPYLVRVLGPGKFGLVQFSIAFSGYFLTLCDYGFNLTGIRSVSVERNDKEKLNSTFSSIMFIKISLLIISFFVLIILINTIKIFESEKLLFILSFGSVVGTVLFPVWYFMGLEKMKTITIIQVGVKIGYTISIFIFISNQQDYILYSGINSGSIIIMGIVALFLILFKLKVKIKIQSFSTLSVKFKEGWNIYVSSIAINIYSTSNTFILGLFAPEIVVGYYAAADKIRLAAHGLLAVISQSIFPHSSALFSQSVEAGKKFTKKIMPIIILIGVILASFLFIFSKLIVFKFLGVQYENSIIILKILSISLLLNSISYAFGFLTIVPMGYDKLYNRIVVTAAIPHLILLLLIVPEYLAVGTSSVLVFTELFLMTQYLVFYNKKIVQKY